MRFSHLLYFFFFPIVLYSVTILGLLLLHYVDGVTPTSRFFGQWMWALCMGFLVPVIWVVALISHDVSHKLGWLEYRRVFKLKDVIACNIFAMTVLLVPFPMAAFHDGAWLSFVVWVIIYLLAWVVMLLLFLMGGSPL